MESSSEQLFAEIIRVLEENLLVEVDSRDEDLLISGALDSLSLVQLMLSLEQRFSITIPLERLEIDDFRSVVSIGQLVDRRLRETRAEAPRSQLSLSVDETGGRAHTMLAAPVAEEGERQS